VCLLLLCVSSYLRKQAETFAFSHGSARPFSLSANHFLLITFCFLRIFSISLFYLLLYMSFFSLSHTQGRRSSIRGVGQIRPLNCLLIYHIIKVKSCAALCCAGIENKIKTVFFILVLFYSEKIKIKKRALYFHLSGFYMYILQPFFPPQTIRFLLKIN
jgi:hypothetical protein